MANNDTTASNDGTRSIVLAFEGGATHTKAAVVSNGRAGPVFTAGPCNPTAYGIGPSARALIEAGGLALAAHTGAQPLAAAIGSAGAVEDAQRRALGEAVCRHFRLERVVVSTDLHPLLLANAWDKPGVLAIAGTGSNVLAHDAAGRMVQVGGRGTLLGDEGSGYMIAAKALRYASRAQDGWGPATRLAEALPHAAKLANFDALITWGAAASKRDIAALSRVVLTCAAEGDAVAQTCVAEEAGLLAEQVLAALARLGAGGEGVPCVYGTGGLFETYPLFVEAFDTRLAASSPLRYAPPPLTGPAAVAVLAQLDAMPAWAAEVKADHLALTRTAMQDGVESVSSTAEAGIDTLSPMEIARHMLAAEASVAKCLALHEVELASLMEAAANVIAQGGRVVYFGAGTSGRLGVLDAAECGPTFGAGPETITAHIAGGDLALRNAVEGAEDDAAAGAREVAEENISANDLVIGIAASGSTPYVRGALEAAKSKGAHTALIACTVAPAIHADIVLALDTGPEVLPGSTRLKAGTATKVVLNIISTGAMALNGRVYAGRMVAMRATNEKLRRRAEAMVSDLAGVSPNDAKGLLEAASYDVRIALLIARLNLNAAEASARLASHGGKLKAALEEPL